VMPRKNPQRYLHAMGSRIWSWLPERRRVCRRNKEDEMRKLLLASVATLGTGGLIGTAMAQAPAGPGRAPSQGQTAYTLGAPTAYVNNNNNLQAALLPGGNANPTPGTIVIHINGKVQTEIQAAWTSVDTRLATAPAAGSTGAIFGNNGTGVVKLSP